MRCRICNSKLNYKIVNLGKQPISSIFYSKKKNNLSKFSLDLYKCKKCKLVQFLRSVPIKKMYGLSYGYQTSISNLMLSHLKDKKKSLEKKKIIRKKISILDIGSNDGSFLNLFDKSFKLFGIDPSSEKFKNFYRKNIFRINNFFSQKNIHKFSKNNKIKQNNFDLITSFAIFYDINNPNLFCKEIYNLLNPKGYWVVEFSYLPLMLKNLTYDQICHEHVTYYSLTVFNYLIQKHNMKIVDVSLNEINGGSIEIICTRKDNKCKINYQKIHSLLKDEKKINNSSFLNFNNRIQNVKLKLNNFFKKNKDRKIIGYGASTKGNIVLNHCNIDNSKLNLICDANKIKIGLYTPGTNIKIISKKKMRKFSPEFLLVLIWPFRKEIIKEEIEFIRNGGKLVFYLPKFHIVDKGNFKMYLKSNFKKLSYKY